ncbi:hypothetical protein HBI56_076060 [Parastagonospora nodorum]|nr:hypothetical protein HBH53_138560 [Parastagonospora nodorum]KAH3983985.1 hypothetical protein HBH52_061390 [Parastagonospora nodorum]KAH3985457.1 hypothetical protein HBH51_020220 [Parastagonospora nodorum]KAH4003871.1 hypothetical protein HBI10_059380 [Parastagonospora nodorum]KAH4028988.1 hypothetical protein HBI13_042980 [Parastagonospora nodorum]
MLDDPLSYPSTHVDDSTANGCLIMTRVVPNGYSRNQVVIEAARLLGMQDHESVVKLVFATASISSRPAVAPLLPCWIAVVVQPRDWLVARPTTSGLRILCSGAPNQTF